MEKIIPIPKDLNPSIIFGNHDKNIEMLEKTYEVEIHYRNQDITISGEQENIEKVSSIIKMIIEKEQTQLPEDVQNMIQATEKGELEEFYEMQSDLKNYKGQLIKYKTINQKKYIDLIKTKAITFGMGPAGTGKTFLAVALAVTALREKQVEKIIITRPAVEAGENLGFLPGDLKEKVDPYLRPIYNALYFLMGKEHTERLIEREIIEIAPLAYMRGRTLDNAYIILDEAQNTTSMQMKMFLTRIGFNSKMIITGDESQIDLPKKVQSGLIHASKILQNISQIGIFEFSYLDVVRHPVVSEIIQAYDKEQQNGN